MSDKDLYDVAREVTDEVMGEGTYADLNATNPNPGVQAAIRRAEPEGHPVRDGKRAKVGDRVKHYGQRHSYREGTATVTGFEIDPEGHPTGWVHVLVEQDRPSLYSDRWDWDRTEVVSKEDV